LIGKPLHYDVGNIVLSSRGITQVHERLEENGKAEEVLIFSDLNEKTLLLKVEQKMVHEFLFEKVGLQIRVGHKCPPSIYSENGQNRKFLDSKRPLRARMRRDFREKAWKVQVPQ